MKSVLLVTKSILLSHFLAKVLFTDCCRWQNFHSSLLRLVNNCVESIYKTQKTSTKVLPSATVGEFSLLILQKNVALKPKKFLIDPL